MLSVASGCRPGAPGPAREIDRPLAAGGTEADGAEDHGFMYSRSFFDLDGHGWQVMWMDPAASAPALAASTRDAAAPA